MFPYVRLNVAYAFFWLSRLELYAAFDFFLRTTRFNWVLSCVRSTWDGRRWRNAHPYSNRVRRTSAEIDLSTTTTTTTAFFFRRNVRHTSTTEAQKRSSPESPVPGHCAHVRRIRWRAHANNYMRHTAGTTAAIIIHAYALYVYTRARCIKRIQSVGFEQQPVKYYLSFSIQLTDRNNIAAALPRRRRRRSFHICQLLPAGRPDQSRGRRSR